MASEAPAPPAPLQEGLVNPVPPQMVGAAGLAAQYTPVAGLEEHTTPSGTTQEARLLKVSHPLPPQLVACVLTMPSGMLPCTRLG